jgi:hypothetical protein
MFVMGEVELGQDFIRVLRVLSYQYHSTAAPYSFLYRLGDGQWDRQQTQCNNKCAEYVNGVL